MHLPAMNFVHSNRYLILALPYGQSVLVQILWVYLVLKLSRALGSVHVIWTSTILNHRVADPGLLVGSGSVFLESRDRIWTELPDSLSSKIDSFIE